MPANIPHRWESHNAHIRLAKANITAYTYTSSSNFDTLPIFGPVRDIEIDDPRDKLDQTAGGDGGHQEIFTRGGVWMIRIGAMQDAAGVSGDSRFALIAGEIVEFVVLLEIGFNIVKGLGKIEGRVTLGAQQGETMMRDMEISRFDGGSLGALVWANLATGVFDG